MYDISPNDFLPMGENTGTADAGSVKAGRSEAGIAAIAKAFDVACLANIVRAIAPLHWMLL